MDTQIVYILPIITMAPKPKPHITTTGERDTVLTQYRQATTMPTGILSQACILQPINAVKILILAKAPMPMIMLTTMRMKSSIPKAPGKESKPKMGYLHMPIQANLLTIIKITIEARAKANTMPLMVWR